MHVLNGLGFALGADVPSAVEDKVLARNAYLRANSGAVVNSAGDVVATSADPGVTRGSAYEAGLNSGGGFPWLLALGGVGLAGAAWYFLGRKKKSL